MAKKTVREEGREVETRRLREVSGTYYTPPADIYETDHAIIVEADMPGVEPAGVDVKIDNGLLAIFGHVERKPIDGVTQFYKEVVPGDYHRAFSIGKQIDESRIAAVITNGVLTVTLPKSEAGRPCRIEVK